VLGVPSLLTALSASGKTLPENENLRFQDIASGKWGFDVDGVRCGENPHTIEFLPDGRTMTLSYEKGVDDAPRLVATYTLIGEGPGCMRMKLQGETRETESGDLVQWDLVFLSPDSYCWHRTDWQEGGCTQPAVRCSVTPDRPIKGAETED
jgi:hypothetical protein